MINVGIAGIGFMGMIHYLAYQKVEGVQVKALCESYHKKRLAGDWTDIKGNFGPPGQIMDLTGIRCYENLDEMIADPELDLIDICLPPAGHADAVVRALGGGKDAFCEKPISLNTTDARRMVDAAATAGKMLLIGHVLPFFPEFQFAYETIQSGKYGKMLGGHFKRVISDPSWLPHFYDPKACGGPMLDLHVHDAHFIRAVCGMPTTVTTVGSMRGEVAERFSSQFRFADPDVSVTAISGVINQQSRSFNHGYEIYLEKATLIYEGAVIGTDWVNAYPVTVLEENAVVRPDIPGGDPVDSFTAEIREVVSCLKDRKPSTLLDGALAYDALVLCEKQTESLAQGKTVTV